MKKGIPAETRSRIDRELQRAEEARANGNEGKARVCARRAAGLAIDIHFQQRHGEPAQQNALKLLRRFLGAPDTPEDLRSAARRLATRLQADHTMPFPEDLLEDARDIIRGLHGSPPE